MDTASASMMCSAVYTVLLGLTPHERWSATGRLSGTPVPQHSGTVMLIAAVVILSLLTALLWWVSRRKKGQTEHQQREVFAESAGRRQLSPRERQILLAVVARSGLGQSEDIFTAVDAFDRGAAKLQEECSQARTPSENESLRMEIASLRDKLGFDHERSHGGTSAAKRPSSRDIPVGKIIELTRRKRDASSIQAEVVRNDDIELAVELPQKLDIQTGDNWVARYDYGTSFWEFDTVTVRCEGMRLTLEHSDRVRFINRRHFPHVAVAVPALVARLPAMRNLQTASAEEQAGVNHGPEVLEPPLFVRGVVIEMTGPGLRIEIPMDVNVGDRLLVMFQLVGAPRSTGPRAPLAASGYAVSDIGRVQHVKRGIEAVSITVEMGGLSEGDVDGLVRFAQALTSQGNPDSAGSEPAVSAAAESHVVAAEGTT
jgi:hypothetical protein